MKAEYARTSLLDRRLGSIDLRSLVWLLLMSTTLFVLLFPFSSYVAALPVIQDEWGLNNTQAGAIFSAYLAGFAVSALVVVPLTDKFGSKNIFVLCTIISTAANVLFPLIANDAITASLLRAFAGLGLVGVYNPGMRIVAERFADRGRGFAVGTFVTFFYASNSVSLTLTGLLMAWFEWRDAYLIMGAASGLSIILAYLLLRKHRSRSASGSSGRLDLSALRNKAARIYITGYSLHAAELYIVRVWLPALLAAALIARGADESSAIVGAATIGGLGDGERRDWAGDGRRNLRQVGTRGVGVRDFRAERRVLFRHRLDGRLPVGAACRIVDNLRLGDSG